VTKVILPVAPVAAALGRSGSVRISLGGIQCEGGECRRGGEIRIVAVDSGDVSFTFPCW